MAVKRRVSGRAMSTPGGIGLGIGIAGLVTVLGAGLLAWLVVTEKTGEGSIGYGCMAIQILSAAVGSMVAYKAIRHRRMLVTGACCGGYYLALLVLSLAFGGGMTGMLTTALMVAVGGGITLIPALLGGRSGARRHKIPTYR